MKKNKGKTWGKVWDEILKDCTWIDRQRFLQAPSKYRKPATLAEVERLYNQVLSEQRRNSKKGDTVKTHELKTWPVYFEALLNHGKNFEIRKADREFEVGDDLVLKEFDKVKNDYTGREIHNSIAYVLRLDSLPAFGPSDDCVHYDLEYVVIALKSQSVCVEKITPVPSLIANMGLHVTAQDTQADIEIDITEEVAFQLVHGGNLKPDELGVDADVLAKIQRGTVITFRSPEWDNDGCKFKVGSIENHPGVGTVIFFEAE